MTRRPMRRTSMRRCAMHCPHTDTRAPAWLNWMAAWIDGWMDACMHACMHAWLHGCMGGRTDGQMLHGRTNGHADGCRLGGELAHAHARTVDGMGWGWDGVGCRTSRSHPLLCAAPSPSSRRFLPHPKPSMRMEGARHIHHYSAMHPYLYALLQEAVRGGSGIS